MISLQEKIFKKEVLILMLPTRGVIRPKIPRPIVFYIVICLLGFGMLRISPLGLIAIPMSPLKSGL